MKGGAPRNVPKTFTPATSAALDEMALTQVLTTIARRPYKAVGIVATDPSDVVFLARQVARFCPNVRLFTLSSDLLLARPSDLVDLRGMLVASTYPLYPSNQWITTPFRDGARVFFSNRGAQGLYNATVAHLWEMGADEPEKRTDGSKPQLLEFAHPYDVSRTLMRTPPVWISTVGERGLYPITFVPKQSAYLYDPRTNREERPLAQWPYEKPQDGEPPEPDLATLDTAASAREASRPQPHLLFWLITLFLTIVACPFIVYVTWVYVAWSADPSKYQREGFPSNEHLLRWLNCDVAKKLRMPIRPAHCDAEQGEGGKPGEQPRTDHCRGCDGRLRLGIFRLRGQEDREIGEQTLT